MAKGKNKSLAIGIVYKAVPIPQDDGPDVDIYVRGLSPSDFTAIMADDGGDELGTMYRRLVNEAVTPTEIEKVALDALNTLPDLMAKLIARAADLPDEWEAVKSFSIGAQIDLIQQIALLTFASENVRKKAMEIVSQYAKVAGPTTPTKPRPRSKRGSGV